VIFEINHHFLKIALTFLISKRKWDNGDAASDGYQMDVSKRARQSRAALAIPRSKKESESGRKKGLQEDKWIRSVEAKRVRCKGCNAWVALREDHNFDLAHWLLHLGKCKQITGVELKRISIAKPKHMKAVCTKSL